MDSTKSKHAGGEMSATLGALVDRVARARGDELACVAEGEQLSYAALLARADALTRVLRAREVGPGDLVAVSVPRSVDLIVAIVGITRAGAAYLPLDLSHPLFRRRLMVADARPILLIGDEAHAADDYGVAAMELPPPVDGRPGPVTLASADDPAYVIYTSGSTGTPKGVVVSQSNIAWLFRSTGSVYQFDSTDVWTMFHSIAFDFSVWEVWGALLHGGVLVIPSHEVTRSPADFHALLLAHGVTVLNQTPAAFRLLQHAHVAAGMPETKLRWLIVGGERLDPSLFRPWVRRHGAETPRICIVYGITETTVLATVRFLTAEDCEGDGPSVIGVPLPEARIALLDEDRRQVALGAVGEIHVRGPGVACGYLTRGSLNGHLEDTRFYADPDASGGRSYRSGDLARSLPDGDLEFIGRVDRQIQLRGFRVELGEVEVALGDLEQVDDVVVVSKWHGHHQHLVAYVVPTGGQAVTPSAIREAISDRLPRYMIPSAIVVITEFPRSSNDKVDIDALPAVGEADYHQVADGSAPVTTTERTMALLWCRILGMECVAREDNFVALGGSSLSAMELVIACEGEWGVRVKPTDILGAGSMQALAASIDQAPEKPRHAAVSPGRDVAALSPGQMSLLLRQRLIGDAPELNEVLAIELRGPLMAESLAEAVRASLGNHPGLHIRIDWRRGVPYQQVSNDPFTVEIEAAEGLDDDGLVERLRELGLRRFILEDGALVRSRVLRRAANRHILLIVAHHIVLDEWSYGLLLDEIGARVRGETPATQSEHDSSSPLAYFVRRNDASVRNQEAMQTHWAKELEGATLSCGLPVSPDGDAEPLAASTINRSLDEATTRLVTEALRREGVTEYEAGLAGLMLAIEHRAHRPDVTLLTLLADRHGETSDLMGYLLDVLPVRVRIEGDPTVRELLRCVRHAIERTVGNRDISLAAALSAGGLSVSGGAGSSEEVFFTVETCRSSRLAIPGVEAVELPVSLPLSRFDSCLALTTGTSRLGLRLEHRRRSLDREGASALLGDTLHLIRELALRPGARLSELQVLNFNALAEVYAAGHGTPPPDTAGRTITQLVEEAGSARPTSAAVVEADGTVVTYHQLLAAANDLARRLAERGVGRGDVVPLILERSASVVASWLGVMRCGAAFGAISPSEPAERLADMIASCNARVLVTDIESFKVDFADHQIIGPARIPPLDGPSVRFHGPHPKQEDLAYVMFTSGSTGRPKAVEIEHGGLARLSFELVRLFGLRASDRTSLACSVAFDPSMGEAWPTLAVGATLVIATDATRFDAPSLRDWIVDSGVTIALASTTVTEAMLGLEWTKNSVLRVLYTVGEVLRRRPPEGLPFSVMNLYGPTECSVYATAAVVSASGNGLPSIGSPLAGLSAHIVDHRGRLCGSRITGELWLGGPQLGRGYRGRPDLTAEAFPMAKLAGGAAERVYRTGDMVRRGDEGELHFVGRRDRQVKFHGVRIELAGIEAVLQQHQAVGTCCVAVRGTAADAFLIAFVEPSDPAVRPSHDELAEQLGRQLGRVFVPAQWVTLDRLPRTSSGKIDRLSLAELEALILETDDEPPRDELEHRVADVFAEVLQRPVTGRRADLLAMGGNSLHVIRVAALIEQYLGAVVPLAGIFEDTTVAGVAKLVLDNPTFRRGTRRI